MARGKFCNNFFGRIRVLIRRVKKGSIYKLLFKFLLNTVEVELMKIEAEIVKTSIIGFL